MNVLLVQIDGRVNLALLRIAAHHRALGDHVWLEKRVTSDLLSFNYDKVYASCIFKYETSQVRLAQLRNLFPTAVVGGTGVDEKLSLESIGITMKQADYSIYPNFKSSIGFTQRGCRLKCPFCVVPAKEGSVREEATIQQIWRGDPWPKEVLLLDNDFFGQPNWQARIDELRDGGFKVSFNQGINIRFINEESANAIASVQYFDDQFKTRRIYTAWDNKKDERRICEGIEHLILAGIAPSHIMVYMLIGYWQGETAKDRDYRREVLRNYGVLPYPMPFERTKELVGFQRWVITHYDQKVDWETWEAAGYQAYNLEWS